MSATTILKPVAESILRSTKSLCIFQFKKTDYIIERMVQLSRIPAVTVEGMELKLLALLATSYSNYEKELRTYIKAWIEQDLAYIKAEQNNLFLLLREYNPYDEWMILLDSIERDAVSFLDANSINDMKL